VAVAVVVGLGAGAGRVAGSAVRVDAVAARVERAGVNGGVAVVAVGPADRGGPIPVAVQVDRVAARAVWSIPS
jgi:hypothetical protein